jgi:hypothetical protein
MNCLLSSRNSAVGLDVIELSGAHDNQAARRDIVDLAIEKRKVRMAGEPLFQPA